jgi:SAM-dependent methyltransferase
MSVELALSYMSGPHAISNYPERLADIKRRFPDYFQKFAKPALDLGCGDRPEHWLPDSVGMDLYNYGQSITHDMTITPWPIDDNQFSYVLAQHILEHIHDGMAFINIMNEAWRVSKPGATFKIAAPHFPSSPNFYRDPTHCRMLNEYSFELFYKDTPIHVGKGYGILCAYKPRSVRVDGNRDLHVELEVVK